MAALNLKKLANAFVPNAVVRPGVPAAMATVTDQYHADHGGLWVGGKVTASPAGLKFVPNAVNRAVHVGLQDTHIPLADIRAVRRVFGWVTGIVVVHHAQGEFRFRCFGATRVADTLAVHLGLIAG